VRHLLLIRRPGYPLPFSVNTPKGGTRRLQGNRRYTAHARLRRALATANTICTPSDFRAMHRACCSGHRHVRSRHAIYPSSPFRKRRDRLMPRPPGYRHFPAGILLRVNYGRRFGSQSFVFGATCFLKNKGMHGGPTLPG